MTRALVRQREEDLRIARNKGRLAAGVSGAGLVTLLALTPILGLPIIIGGSYLTWKWFKFRLDKGLRF